MKKYRSLLIFLAIYVINKIRGKIVKQAITRKKIIILILAIIMIVSGVIGIIVLIENKTEIAGDFYVKKYDSGYEIVGLVNEEQKEVVIPKWIETFRIKKVSDFLKDNEHVESITIKSGVEEIEENAFSGCRKLRTVIIPQGIARIGNYILSGSRGITSLTAPFEEGQTLKKYFGSMYAPNLKQITVSNGSSEICEKAFLDYRILEKITMPKSVTRIEKEAFNGCSNLLEVEFSQELREIGESAFSRTAIKELELPNGIQKLGKGAFEGCKGLERIVLPSSLIEIKENAFKECAIEEINVPSSITKIAKGVFEGNKALKSIDLSSVEEIGAKAFYNCEALDKITLSQELASVGESAFSGTAVSEITMPNKITTLSDGVFENCTALQKVELGNVEEIGNSAFENCTALSDIDVSGVKKIGESAFERCENLLSLNVENAKVIGDYAFSGLKKISEIKIPYDAEEIGNGILWRNTELKQVEIPLDKNNLIYYTGATIEKLEKVIIPKGSIKLSDNAFDEYKSVKFELAETIKEIGKRAFSGMKFINISLPTGLSSLQEGAFYDCVNLSSITLPNNITTISNNLFYNCTNLVYVSGEGIKEIEDYAFSNCAKLKEPNFLSRVTKVGKYSFYNCSSLISRVEIGCASEIGESAFSDCVNVIEFILTNNEVKIGRKAFNNCEKLERIINLSCASEIGSYAFNNCVKLSALQLGDKLKVLEEGVFYDCKSIIGIELPRNIERVNSKAFYNCIGIEKVVIKNEQVVVFLESIDAFLGCSVDLEIQVNKDLLSIYQQSNDWKLLNIVGV